MTVVDASVFVSVYHVPDAFHQPSIAWLQQHIRSSGIIVAPLLVLSEVAGPIARQTGDAFQAREAVQHIRALPHLYLVPLDEALADLSAGISADLRLRGADAVYVALAYRFGLPLMTWDAEQFQRGSQRVPTQHPDGS